MLFFLYVLVCKKIETCLRIRLSIVTTIAIRKRKKSVETMATQVEHEPTDLDCVICLNICNTMTDCNHTICMRCYNLLVAQPLSMRKCPYCRKEDPALCSTTHVFTEKERDAHYCALLEYFNEMNALPEPKPRANTSLKRIILEYGLNRVIDQTGREISYSCPLYDADRELMGTLGEIKDKSYNRKVVNKYGFLLGDVDEVVLYYDTDATYW